MVRVVGSILERFEKQGFQADVSTELCCKGIGFRGSWHFIKVQFGVQGFRLESCPESELGCHGGAAQPRHSHLKAKKYDRARVC